MKKTHVLMVNLGSPDAPNPQAIRRYLKQFLSDRRVVDLPRVLWWLILHIIILNIRPKKITKAYQSIWQSGKKSPLIESSYQLIADIKQASDTPECIHLAMTYGKPSITDALHAIHFEPTDKLLVLPMFPQNSSATAAAVFDAMAGYFKNKRHIPNIEFVHQYHDHPLYISALAKSVKNHWQTYGQAEKLLISFHGIPRRYIDTGDMYLQQCQTTADLLVASLELRSTQYQLCFQSRFGREPWLEPYADKTLAELGASGVTSVDVISPGFSVDCLETLEELAIAGKEIFEDAGGKTLRYIPALNNQSAHITLWQDIIHTHR